MGETFRFAALPEARRDRASPRQWANEHQSAATVMRSVQLASIFEALLQTMNRYSIKIALSLALCLSCSVPALSQQLQYGLLSQQKIMARLRDAPKNNGDRAAELGKMFHESGCQPSE